MFIHFTTAADAAAIVASGVLLPSRTIVGAVYAAPVGGVSVPGVQRGGGSLDVWHVSGRQAAVLFDVAVAPDTVFPEEAIWRRDSPLPLVAPVVVSAADAVAALDGSLPVDDDGVHGDAVAALGLVG